MMNMFTIVGRIAAFPKKGVPFIKIACPRAYKNQDGTYDTDIIPIKLSGVIEEKTLEYCKKGDIVGIKGHFEATNGKCAIIADKVSFLSSKGPGANDEEDN